MTISVELSSGGPWVAPAPANVAIESEFAQIGAGGKQRHASGIACLVSPTTGAPALDNDVVELKTVLGSDASNKGVERHCILKYDWLLIQIADRLGMNLLVDGQEVGSELIVLRWHLFAWAAVPVTVPGLPFPANGSACDYPTVSLGLADQCQLSRFDKRQLVDAITEFRWEGQEWEGLLGFLWLGFCDFGSLFPSKCAARILKTLSERAARGEIQKRLTLQEP